MHITYICGCTLYTSMTQRIGILLSLLRAQRQHPLTTWHEDCFIAGELSKLPCCSYQQCLFSKSVTAKCVCVVSAWMKLNNAELSWCRCQTGARTMQQGARSCNTMTWRSLSLPCVWKGAPFTLMAKGECISNSPSQSFPALAASPVPLTPLPPPPFSHPLLMAPMV